MTIHRINEFTGYGKNGCAGCKHSILLDLTGYHIFNILSCRHYQVEDNGPGHHHRQNYQGGDSRRA